MGIGASPFFDKPMNTNSPNKTYTAQHWGLYEVTGAMSSEMRISAYLGDPAPSPIGLHMGSDQTERNRVMRPAVRRGWLAARTGSAGHARGGDEYVEVEWEEALDLVAGEVDRVRKAHGNEAIFGGSYGWASAGRFHHAQSQIHRFLNCAGGYVRHVDSYSLGAARALMPHLVASMDWLMHNATDWNTMAENTRLFLSFGGAPAKNAQIAVGGTAEHRLPGGLRRLREAGVRFVNVSPVRDDIDTGGKVEWFPIRPNTDTALILALAYVLQARGLHDLQFLSSHCVGYEKFERYLLGEVDGQAKTPQWAAQITGLRHQDIEQLALDLASHRSMINMAWSLQRAHHGEQPFWALLSLASMLGQIGLPGGGFSVCYGAENLMGSPHRRLFGPTFQQGRNPVSAFIPVARISDMLLRPGTPFEYQGETHVYPDVRLIYWAGGNPFHHHQDLRRLVEAWQKPETIVVHEQYWTPTAKMADLVLPATTTLERNDIFYAAREPVFAAMKRAQPPRGQSRDDYWIFADLSRRLGFETAFTEGRTADEWVHHLYAEWRARLAAQDISIPSFEDFWATGIVPLPQTGERVVLLSEFRNNPQTHKLDTPSGRIELFSSRIAEFGLKDCPGYACWMEPHEWLGANAAKRFPLHLISDQPKNKLHSQLDHSPNSQSDKIGGREPVTINDQDACTRGIRNGDLVRVFNARGACIAAAVPSADIRPGVVRLSTGAWFDPDSWSHEGPMLEKHGNPNVLTADVAASSFSQGCAAQTCLVEIEKWTGPVPNLTAYELPSLREV